MGVGVKVRVWGDYALFSRPEMKVERCSYDVITPSAARGILEAIYWHPGMKCPILFIHGAEDHFVPTRMSVQMHEMRRESTELLIVPGAAHAVSFNTDRALYESAVDAFLNRYVYGREEEKHE